MALVVLCASLTSLVTLVPLAGDLPLLTPIIIEFDQAIRAHMLCMCAPIGFAGLKGLNESFILGSRHHMSPSLCSFHEW